jgi:hypothetical protein
MVLTELFQEEWKGWMGLASTVLGERDFRPPPHWNAGGGRFSGCGGGFGGENRRLRTWGLELLTL